MIRLTGTGSGLDINSLVDGLVAASRTAPESRINTKQSDVSSEISALGRVKSALSALQTASETISEADAFNVAKITSSNSDSIEATDGGSDYRGSFNLEVLAKAQAHKLRSDSFSDATTDNGAGDITLSNAKGESFSITLASDASSLDEMAEAINTSSDNFGVQANVLKVDDGDYRLVLSATDTGTDAALTLDVSGFDSGIAFSEMAAAQDARVNVDGITVTRSSNTFDDIFPNIDININNAVVGDSTLIQAQGDSDAVEERLNTFVNAYNSFRDVIDSVSGSGAALNGDGLTRQLASQMRQLLAGTGAEANPSYQTAYSVGIEIDRYGKASLDSSKLSDALEVDANVLDKLFTGSNGLATLMESRLDDMLSSTGAIDSREDSLASTQESLVEQLTNLEERMERYETRLFAQFNAMDSIVSSLNSTSNYLASALSNLNSSSN